VSGNTNTESRAIDDPARLRSPREIAALRGLTTAFLDRKRRTGGGPRFFKTGPGRTAAVRYRLCDVDAWIEAHMAESSSQTWGPARKADPDRAA
jgi:predicted DNA-binding transcriptional regulator AlpA